MKTKVREALNKLLDLFESHLKELKELSERDEKLFFSKYQNFLTTLKSAAPENNKDSNHMDRIQLPNARQDEPYLVKLSGQTITKIVFTKDIGLKFDEKKRCIEGTPLEAGEFKVILHPPTADILEAVLFVNPNPEKLWNNLPSKNGGYRFWKEDSYSEKKDNVHGVLIAGRQRGRTHANKGTCCDDHFEMAYHPETGMSILAVSDGAGSAEFSRYGSKVLVETATKKILELLDNKEKSYRNFAELPNEEVIGLTTRHLLTNAVQAAYLKLEDKAQRQSIPVKSLSATLLVAITLPLKNGKWYTASYWVGDGAVAVFDTKEKEVNLLGKVDSGAYSGETQFLTQTEANAEKVFTRIATDTRDNPPVVFLMTDGVSDPKFKSDKQLEQYEPWESLWHELHKPLQAEEPEKELEKWLDFFSKGEHDDRTLAMFIPHKTWDLVQNTNVEELLKSENTENAKAKGVVEPIEVDLSRSRAQLGGIGKITTSTPAGRASAKPLSPTGTGEGQTTPSAGAEAGETTPTAGTGEGQTTPSAGAGAVQDTTVIQAGEGETTPSAGTGEGQATPPSGTGEGQTPPTAGTGEGQTTPSAGAGEGETPPTAGTGEGETPPTAGTGEGQTTPTAGTGEGQTTPSVGAGEGETPPTAGTGEGQTTPSAGAGEGETTPTAGAGAVQDTIATQAGEGETTPTAGAGAVQDTTTTQAGEGQSDTASLVEEAQSTKDDQKLEDDVLKETMEFQKQQQNEQTSSDQNTPDSVNKEKGNE